jgi:hypothetical protein
MTGDEELGRALRGALMGDFDAGRFLRFRIPSALDIPIRAVEAELRIDSPFELNGGRTVSLTIEVRHP